MSIETEELDYKAGFQTLFRETFEDLPGLAKSSDKYDRKAMILLKLSLE